MVGPLLESSKMVKLQLQKPSQSASSSSPAIVPSSPSSANIQRVELPFEVANESHGLIALPSFDPTVTPSVTSVKRIKNGSEKLSKMPLER